MDEFGIIVFLILLIIIFPIIGWLVLLGRIGEVSRRLLSMEAMLQKILEKKSDVSAEEATVAEPVAQRSAEALPTLPQTDMMKYAPQAREYISVTPPPPPPREIVTSVASVPPPPAPVEVAPVIEPPKPAAPAAPSAPKPAKKINYEEFIGGNLFGKIGIFVLVVGIGLFVKYAIDNEWINEVSRTILGFATGSGLLVIAAKLQKKYRAFSSLLAGGAFATFYVTVAVAYHYYQLFSQPVAFVILVVLTVFMAALAVLYDRRELAVIALLGGYIAPFLTSSGEGNYMVLFSYIAILNVGMFMLSFFKKWAELPMISFFSTYLIMLVFLMNTSVSDPVMALRLLLFASLFYVIFLLPLLSILRNDRGWVWTNRMLLMTVVLNNFVYMGFSLLFIDHLALPVKIHGLFPLGIAIVNMAAILWLRQRRLEYQFLLHTLLGVVLTFVSIAVPVQLEGTFITLFWASEMVLLGWLYAQSKARMYAYFSFVLVWLTLISFVMDIAPYEIDLTEGQTIFANKLFATNAFVCLSYLALGVLIGRYREAFNKTYILRYTPANAVLILLSAFLGNVVVVSEMSRFAVAGSHISLFQTSYILFLSIALSRRFRLGAGWSWAYFLGMIVSVVLYALAILPYESESGRTAWMILATVVAELVWVGVLYYRNTPARSSASNGFTIYLSLLATATWTLAVRHLLHTVGWNDSLSAGFSIALSVAGFALMTLGMRKHLKTLRMLSLGVFAVVLGKLLIVDVWTMPIAGKIAVFILLGVILLLLSFLYQKLKNVLFSDERDETEKEENE
ncbi:DUF2339 domain-containing protein [Tannerella sp.]|uniref:DUF2339 domain-containing protein n=1 Tax=Tannerella sp. TaxID=2382127 RepID=UPI0026DACD34|nr:DUF2339 domain-containing protein [Tannerella sp.]MDO4703756.1 DUF2339 domain-containing protein [Tannerella sp.]